jgi:hypothetical protein
MDIHRGRGRPRRGEVALSRQVNLRIPLPLWAEIERLAGIAGVTAHAWMRKALQDQVKVDEKETPR